MMLGMWLASVGTALVVARFRLSSPAPTLRDELLAVRGVAFLAVTFALSGFSLASIAFTTTSLTNEVIVMGKVALPGWAAHRRAAAPHLATSPDMPPPIRRSTGGLLVSSETWVYVSVARKKGALKRGGHRPRDGLLRALARLLMTRPELT